MSKSCKWIVEQKYYDNNKVEVRILTEEEARAAGYPLNKLYFKETEKYDLYAEVFNTHRQAKEVASECRKA